MNIVKHEYFDIKFKSTKVGVPLHKFIYFSLLHNTLPVSLKWDRQGEENALSKIIIGKSFSTNNSPKKSNSFIGNEK